jgi:LysR family transcriptional regulator, low CO2-responsive transcriptional regulator
MFKLIQVGEALPVDPRDVVVNPVRLAVFCAAVEHGGFTRAAEALSLTPPAVSMHVRALEQVWGTALFDRKHRDGRLTEAGHAVYDFAIGVLQANAAVRARVNDLLGGQAGTVTLGATPVQCAYILAPALARFREQHPAAELRLSLLQPQSVGDEVLKGHIDIGIGNEITPIERTLRTEPLWVEPMVIVAPRQHPLARKSRLTLVDLTDQPFVVGGTGDTAGDRALDTALARAGLPPRRVVMRAGLQDGAKRAVLAGAGLAVLFQRVVEAGPASEQLVALPLEGPPLEDRFFLVYRSTHQFSPLAEALVYFLREEARRIAPHAAR